MSLILRAVATIVVVTVLFAFAGVSAVGAPTPPRILVTDVAQSLPVDVYDSPRKANQLAIYDAHFGRSTMTLGPCSEAAIVDGVVLSVGRSGNTPIPSTGFCVSGDGKAGAWIDSNLKVGQRVEVRLAPGWGQRTECVRTVDGLNASRKSEGIFVYTASVPPGVRATDTGDQCWEAVVEGGLVTSVGGKNGRIPATGFIVAAYGSGAKEWASTNLELGTRVSLQGDRLTVVGDALRYVYRARVALADVSRLIDSLAAKASLGVPIPPALSARRIEMAAVIDTAQRELDSGSPESATLNALDAIDLAAGAQYMAASTKLVEFRGVWHRPVEQTRDAVAQTVRTLAEANVNMVFLEVFYGGRTIYPSSLAEQNRDFVGEDILRDWVEEAHHAGIELHAWIHTLRFVEQGPILQAHPSWAAVYRPAEQRNSTPVVPDSGVDFADPANPEVRSFVLGLVKELATGYGLDGIHLDYIRYGSGDDIPPGYNYSDWSRAAFKAEIGVDPADISSRNPLVWREWKAWRLAKVSELVRDVRSQILSLRPSMALSAAVVGDLAAAKNTRLQDWPRWVEDGLLDFTTPMLYHTDAGWVEAAAKKTADAAGARAFVIAGVGPFLGLESNVLSRQIQGARSGGAQGEALFALHSLTGGQLRALQAGVFSQPAVVPYRGQTSLGVAVAATVRDLRGWLAPRTLSPATVTELNAAADGLASACDTATLLSILVRMQKSASTLTVPDLSRRLDELIQLAMMARRWDKTHGLPSAIVESSE